MFEVFKEDMERILREYGIGAEIVSFSELQRYHYEKGNPNSKEVRLIDKIQLENRTSLVIRFKNESDVSLELVEKQSQFAELLRTHGIPSPMQYQTNGSFAKWYHINEYDVIVTVEEFVDGELKYVTPEIAEQTGRLLAQTHSISEQHDFHVNNAVLFDPFTKNDLFNFNAFQSIARDLPDGSLPLYQKITNKYREYMWILSPLQSQPRYAVQGDISDCNLYQLKNGALGIFDFNRCGDNNLFCDAVMQAVFEARLMNYPEPDSEIYGEKILLAFLRGYQSLRPFNDLQKKLLPYLYAVIDAFWAPDILWGENSLLKERDRRNYAAVHKWLEEIWRRLHTFSEAQQQAD